jgi:hypothetical protein
MAVAGQLYEVLIRMKYFIATILPTCVRFAEWNAMEKRNEF